MPPVQPSIYYMISISQEKFANFSQKFQIKLKQFVSITKISNSSISPKKKSNGWHLNTVKTKHIFWLLINWCCTTTRGNASFLAIINEWKRRKKAENISADNHHLSRYHFKRKKPIFSSHTFLFLLHLSYIPKW